MRPIHLPFNFPYLPPHAQISQNYQNYQNYQNPQNSSNTKNEKKSEDLVSHSKESESSDYFFEIFGLKLYFDDVLIICILFCLYKEDVHDEELFLCLILLLLS